MRELEDGLMVPSSNGLARFADRHKVGKLNLCSVNSNGRYDPITEHAARHKHRMAGSGDEGE